MAFDNWQCGICHSLIIGNHYETHHLDYSRLGHEDMEHDLITLCITCHKKFHAIWKKQDFWNPGRESPLAHWRAYSLQDTARLCSMYRREDYWQGGKENLCNENYTMGLIDRYFAEMEITEPVVISEHDIMMVFRNWRYDIILKNAADGVDPEQWLDATFGPKGGKGGNPVRAQARAFYTKHPVAAIKRIYKEDPNIIILMDEIKKMEEQNNEQA